MSKIRPAKTRRRQREAKNTPTGRPSNEDLEKAKEEITLLDKIDSDSSEERVWVLGSIARLVVEEPKTFQLVVENSNVIERLVKRIFDPEFNIRIAACGVVRNLTALGDHKVCEKIISHDCLYSLTTIVKDFATKKSDNEFEQSQREELLVNSLATLSNMSEFTTSVMVEILKEGLLPVFFQFMRPNTNLQISIEAAELLVLITEDYEPCIQQITEDDILLLKITLANQKNNVLLRILAAEILVNVIPPKDRISTVKVAMVTLVSALDFEAPKLFLEFQKSESIMKDLENGLLPNELEKQIITWDNDMKAQIKALEVLANILVGDDDEAEPMEEENTENNIMVPLDIIQLYNTAGICNKLLPKCKFMETSISNLYQLKMIKSYLDRFSLEQSRALSCLNNILLCFPVQALGDISGLWSFMFGLCGQFTVTPNLPSDTTSLSEIQNLITNILYSILRKSNNIVPESWQVEALFKLLSHTDQEIRTNIIGLLGCIAKSPLAPVFISEIGVALLKGLEDPSGWVVTEALDVIFSVFDDHFDETVVKLGILEKVKQSEFYLLQKIKEAKGDELLLDRLDEARINIPQFLEYKRSQNK